MSEGLSRTFVVCLVVFGVSLLSIGVVAGAQQSVVDGATDGPDDQNKTYLRVVHTSPAAPAVDVYLDGEIAIRNVSFGTVPEYRSVSGETHDLTITEAGAPESVVFEGSLSVQPRTVNTLVVSVGTDESPDTPFVPVIYRDDALTPTGNDTALSLVHLSRITPPVDVTIAEEETLLADDLVFLNATGYRSLPAGQYTLEVRRSAANDDGELLAEQTVILEAGTAYSILTVPAPDTNSSVGQFSPTDRTMTVDLTSDPGAAIQIHVVEDATISVSLPQSGPPHADS